MIQGHGFYRSGKAMDDLLDMSINGFLLKRGRMTGLNFCAVS